jgi:hypothetical protein
MACARCGGQVVREQPFDPYSRDSTDNSAAERCLNCGAIEDAIIRANRLQERTLHRSREPRGPHRHHLFLTPLPIHSMEPNHHEHRDELDPDQPDTHAAHPANQPSDPAYDPRMEREPME